MPRETPARKTVQPAGRKAEGPALEQIDRELVKLVNQRAKLVQQLAGKDPATALSALHEHDDASLERSVEHSKGPLPAAAVKTILREIHSGCRAQIRVPRVAFLGPLYSYSHLATLQRFGSSVEFAPVGSISAVFEEVNRAHVQFGVVPIENSTDGRIADTLDMFTRLHVKICGEVQVRIHHCLLGRCRREDIQEVYSRPQAISQCRNWLARHLPQARVIEVTSTTTAAQLAKDKQGVAAVASAQAGVHYDLEVLAANIEDNPANVTRFAVIGESAAPRTGKDKTAVLFEIEHRPGSLADAINVVKLNRLNLTWIESFPLGQPVGTYCFFMEMDGHESDAPVRRALEQLQRRTRRLVVLGSYPRSVPLDAEEPGA